MSGRPDIVDGQPPNAAPSVPPPLPTPGSPRWRFGARTVAILLTLLVALDVWAIASTDGDFFLPDVFRPIGLALVLAFALSGALPWKWPRRGVRILASVIVVALLILEMTSRFRDVEEDRIEATSDVLLRYRYRPGAWVGTDRLNDEMRINHLGLWDREYAIPKPADVYRVVVLTGSIANDGSIPFDARFHEILERRLEGALPDGRRIEVINASCEGYNAVQQVRLLERVAMEYEPDFVLVAYMLTSASLQNGAYRRIGNSYFAFRFIPLFDMARTGSICSVFAHFHESYSFDLIVRNSLERLALLREQHGFRTLVAVLPVLEDFEDPVCDGLYDLVATTARESGHESIEVVDAFRGEDFLDFAKPGQRDDVCHPNEAGHERIAGALEAAVRRELGRPTPAQPTPAQPTPAP